MSAYKNFIWFLIIAILISFMQSETKKSHFKNVAPKAYSVPYDTLNEDLASFISGMEHGKSGCLARLDTTTKWRQFSIHLDSGFFDLDTSRFAKMEKWADTELLDCRGSKTHILSVWRT